MDEELFDVYLLSNFVQMGFTVHSSIGDLSERFEWECDIDKTLYSTPDDVQAFEKDVKGVRRAIASGLVVPYSGEFYTVKHLRCNLERLVKLEEYVR